jgi:hypothetical protein
VPTLGWVRTALLIAQRCSKVNIRFGMLSFEQFEFATTGTATADPSTALRSGRDDKVESSLFPWRLLVGVEESNPTGSFPQRLKPLSLEGLYVRAEARTLQ